MDDASLDEFLDSGDGETGDGSDTDTNSEGTGSDSVEPQATAVEPATVTHQWSPAGGNCEGCGARVERRWHSEAGLVCPECKEW